MCRVFVAGLAACLLLPAGCGYHTAGSSAHLPNTVHTLAVPTFQNATQSYHTEVAYTQAVIKETQLAVKGLAYDAKFHIG